MASQKSLPQILVSLALAAAAAGTAVLAPTSARSGETAPEPVRFGRDIRPILSDRCFKCHGPDPASRQEELRLDLREDVVADRGGYAVIVPGDPEASELWHRIDAHDPEDLMPPSDSNKKRLSEDEKELVRRWIEDGAPYEKHWAFVPPARPELPPVKNGAWVRNEVDRFILARLEAAGLTPSPEADRGILLRRVFLDLTGLPPTAEELAAFLADARPDAYERWVDKLLTEEPYLSRYAERLATPWLDSSRYADTSGIHMDAGRQIWPWRDWVLKAFRDNLPFDRFVTEQLAGDLLPDATMDQVVASGFNRNHVTSDEGGAIDEEYRVEYAVDRTATTGSVFLGLTMGCARCHEHKFDPISQEDFYRFYAFFNSVEEPGIYTQIPDSNRALEPFLSVPSQKQQVELAELRERLAAARSQLDQPMPEDEQNYADYLKSAPAAAGVAWLPAQLSGATSTGGSTLTPQPDGSVLVSGENPDREDHHILLRTQETNLRLLLLEGLQDASFPLGRVGRAPNGNAVLSAIAVEAVSLRDPSQKQNVRLVWAWADHEQPDADFDVVNVLDPSPARGWAVNAHGVTGGRTAMFLAEEPFGFTGGTELRVTLSYQSVYAQHTLGRVRLTPGRIGDGGLASLPLADSRWYLTGPFLPPDKTAAYDQVFGPEEAGLDFARKFGEGGQAWNFSPDLRDGVLKTDLPGGLAVTFAGKRIFVPSARSVDVSLGSDDGVQVYVDGARVYENRIDRASGADQDKATLQLEAGVHDLVVKIVNTGGIGGIFWRSLPRAEELAGELVWSLAPAAAREQGAGELSHRMKHAWRIARSPSYRALTEEIAAAEQSIAQIEAAIPRTMVMKELATKRTTYLLVRGQYDHPDTSKEMPRDVPEALGRMPEGAPDSRLGLAQWLTGDDNPLVSRVFVNRLWELMFGLGIVATSEDFGLQGDWPSHPELLDWLAVDFRDSGWDVRATLRNLVTSATYRQSSAARPLATEIDPENRLLASYPRRRLGAEEVRDQALYLSGLLVEQFGGPSVKPYQPEGLWQEVAMLQSNTRIYERGNGDDLWRRSLYTYWKRACPPPSLMTFDAPTREFCSVRRSTTNTPLQALVLWNDEQYVEAARVFAQRTLTTKSDDGERLSWMFTSSTGRAPDAHELDALHGALTAFRERYLAAPEDAQALLAVGETVAPMDLDASELAAWTLIANAIFSLDATITRS
jgi:hypothetical protein